MREGNGAYGNIRPAMAIRCTGKFSGNNTKHATDNDTDIKLSKKKSLKYFKKIPLDYQRMLLVASSSGEATPDMPNKNAIHFFQNTIPFNAQIIIECLFEENKLKV